MKKVLLLTLAICLMFSMSAFAKRMGKKDKGVSLNGIVTDPACAKSGDKAKMTDAACAKKCAKDGKLAFVNDADGKVWEVENSAKLKGHEGHHVTITGHPNADKGTVHVTSVAMMKEDSMKKDEMKK